MPSAEGITQKTNYTRRALGKTILDVVSITTISTIKQKTPYGCLSFYNIIVIETAVKKTVRWTVFRRGVSMQDLSCIERLPPSPPRRHKLCIACDDFYFQ